MNNFKVYVIRSHKNINDIEKDVDNAGGCIYSGIIYTTVRRNNIKSKEETDKTVVFCTEETRNKLEEMNDYKDRISDFDWSKIESPKEDEVWSLHLNNLPSDFKYKDLENFLSEYLGKVLPKCNSEGKENYSLNFPFNSRTTDTIRGYGTIEFADHVDKEIIKMCKMILHDTRITHISENKINMTSCLWFNKNIKSRKFGNIKILRSGEIDVPSVKR